VRDVDRREMWFQSIQKPTVQTAIRRLNQLFRWLNPGAIAHRRALRRWPLVG